MAVRFVGEGKVELVGDLVGRWDGPLVVLLHGGGQTRFSWSKAAAALADKGYLALSLDARGHGDSDWSPDGVYTLDSYAADVSRVVEQLNKPAALVGASLGGLTSILAAGEDPTINCTSLVLVDVTPRMSETGVAAIEDFMLAHTSGFATLKEAADAISAYLPHRPRPRDSHGLRKNLRHRDDGRYYWHWDPRFLNRTNGPRSMPPERLERALTGMESPLLLVRGSMSEIVGELQVAALRMVVPDATYVDVPEAAHMIAGDQNDVFTEVIIDFLDRHVRNGPS